MLAWPLKLYDMQIKPALSMSHSLLMTNELRLAIDMLAMNQEEIDKLIEEEMLENPFLEEAYEQISPPSYSLEMLEKNSISEFEVALKTTAQISCFREQLLSQANLFGLNQIEKAIAYMLIYSLDDDGLLNNHEQIYKDIICELGVFTEWIESVRKRLMSFEPIGCGAINIEEALIFQIKSLGLKDPKPLLEAFSTVRNRALTSSEIKNLHSSLPIEILKKELRPRPALASNSVAKEHIINHKPDILIRQFGEKILISLCNNRNLQLLSTEHFSINKLVEERKRRAKWLIRSFKHRENSLLKLANSIVKHQRGWFLRGESLKPLTLKVIADDISLHQSSVSRLLKNKYCLCTQGLKELKYFFSYGLKQDHSSQSVKELIKNIIAKEDRKYPLSDQKIQNKVTELLGLKIARRTVTKYRKHLKIGSMSIRKSSV